MQLYIRSPLLNKYRQMVATISADIVSSTSLDARDLLELRRRLSELFGRIAEDSPGFWGRIVRGDGIECFVPEYRGALRIAILMKLYVKMAVAGWNCSPQLRRFGIRFSIGMGAINYADREEDIIDGPAIYISGRNLDAIGRSRAAFTCVEVDGCDKATNCLLDSYVAMVDNVLNSYSVKQAEVVFYKLRGYKETQISGMIGVKQSAVNSRSTLADWNLLGRAVRSFENFDFGKACG